MDWLWQNWIWIALAVGVFFFISRMAGRGMGRAGAHHHGSEHGSDGGIPDQTTGPGTAFDPVNQHAITGGTAVSSIYRGRAFYFENRENRDLFESDPEKYLKGAATAGQLLEREHEYAGERHRRHGCC